MILVEGLDNTGKTTLVAHLAEQYPQLQVRPSIGNKHDLKEIRTQAYDEAYRNNPLMLADRSRIISEWTYNPILNKRPIAYPFDVWMSYLTRFVHHPHYVIHCWRDLETVGESFDNRDQLEGVGKNLAALNERYNEMMNMLDLLFDLTGSSKAVMWYNFEVDHLDLIHREVEEYLKEVQK